MVTLQISPLAALRTNSNRSFLVGPILTPLWSVLVAQNVRILSQAGSSVVQVFDAMVTRSTGASTVTDYQITIQAIDSALNTFESLHPSIATVDSTGLVTGVSAGRAIIRVNRSGITRDQAVTVTAVPSTAQDTFLNWATGTLAKHATDYVDTDLVGKSTASAIRIFSTQNHTTQSYVRNSSLWCAGLAPKLTCCSPWNSTGANTRAGTLVTPRHILYAAHYPIPDGDTIRFITADGTVITRTQIKRKIHPNYSPFFPDLVIGVLDSDLPASITPCLVPPTTFEQHFSNLDYGVPCVCLDQEEKALVTDFSGADSNLYRLFREPTDSKRLEFYEPKISGDSGNPAFMVVNGELVLLTVWTFGGGGAGTNVENQITALNQMIVDADTLAGYSTVDDPTWPNAAGHYKLKEADLSGFPSYG